MANFLFWNLYKKDLAERIARLVGHHQVDVLMLAESDSTVRNLQGTLTAAGLHGFQVMNRIAGKVTVCSRIPSPQFVAKDVDLSRRVSTFEVTLDGMKPFLLATLHLPDPHNFHESDRSDLAPRWAKHIRTIETSEKHSRTVLVGDFNMDPFERGMISSESLHAVMTRETAEKIERTVQGESLPFFYNPMWGFYGDRTPGPPGTYYLQKSVPVNYFWHMYDQVLVRPELIDHLRHVQILDHDGQESLVDEGTGLPDSSNGSDHLPLLFRIERT